LACNFWSWGVIILAASIYGVFFPPENPVMFENLHPGIYLGAVLTGLGFVYAIKFRPASKKG
jgi:hypothetical protein